MADGKVWFGHRCVEGDRPGDGPRRLRAGDRGIATSRRPTTFAATVGDAEGFLAVEMSIPTVPSIQRAVDQALARFGRIDVLVNNAGYSLLGSVEEPGDEEVRRNFDVNDGVLAVQRAVLVARATRWAGHQPLLDLRPVTGPAMGHLLATKAAVLMISEASPPRRADFGVRSPRVPGRCPHRLPRPELVARAESGPSRRTPGPGRPPPTLVSTTGRRRPAPGGRGVRPALPAGEPAVATLPGSDALAR